MQLPSHGILGTSWAERPRKNLGCSLLSINNCKEGDQLLRSICTMWYGILLPPDWHHHRRQNLSSCMRHLQLWPWPWCECDDVRSICGIFGEQLPRMETPYIGQTEFTLILPKLCNYLHGSVSAAMFVYFFLWSSTFSSSKSFSKLSLCKLSCICLSVVQAVFKALVHLSWAADYFHAIISALPLSVIEGSCISFQSPHSWGLFTFLACLTSKQYKAWTKRPCRGTLTAVSSDSAFWKIKRNITGCTLKNLSRLFLDVPELG